jgi:glucan endo-1,6-beta-glucosidase
MATLSHIDPDFSSVIAIQAVNEPERDSSLTPGLKDCELIRVIAQYNY